MKLYAIRSKSKPDHFVCGKHLHTQRPGPSQLPNLFARPSTPKGVLSSKRNLEKRYLSVPTHKAYSEQRIAYIDDLEVVEFEVNLSNPVVVKGK